jgi:hypothetical protein
MKCVFKLICTVLTSLAVASAALADPATCQKQVATQYAGLMKKQLKSIAKCLDKDNSGTLPGPCPDVVTAAKLSILKGKVEAKVAAACTMADFAAIGFGGCALDTPSSAAETDCAALPATTSAEQAACVSCWKLADAGEMLATLYASHAAEVCGTLGSGSTTCSSLDCTTPTPDQRDLGATGESDCQKAVGGAGVKYLLAREKQLRKCALAGRTQADCLTDPKIELALAKAEARKVTAITNKCGGRTPQASPPFC